MFYDSRNIILDNSSSQVFDRRRTLKERLFTIPWRPLVKNLFKQVPNIPDGEVIVASDKIVMNRVTYDNFKNSVVNKDLRSNNAQQPWGSWSS